MVLLLLALSQTGRVGEERGRETVKIVVLFDVGVKAVLDHVFWSVDQVLRDLAPAGPDFIVEMDDLEVFFLCERLLVYRRIEGVNISLSYLFPGSFLQVSRY